ncbi:phage head spike fiber domain-containing protein [Calidithermus chliarophilus]|uniref:phage head spike fiber domain-containing protein n=1 Tax=Calidithermus chliarophilus TaxID=52023 RepID=UPI000414CB58|nr:carbohydrate binding domain-containing protein [Calidithermus chliarophilus]
MPQASKYISAPWKAHPTDAYGDPAEVFTARLRELLAVVGAKLGTPGDPSDKGFFPAAADLDNGSPNLLDWGDHSLWLATDATGGGATRDYTGSFVYTEGHENNWKPAYFYRGNLVFRNVGATADLPAVSQPAGYRCGSIDLTPNSADGRYKAQFRLKPNTTYTFSFYVKKLASGAFRFRVGTGTDAGFGDGTWGTEAQASNRANLLVDDTLAPPNAWTRISATFTTGANGYVWVMWGGWTSWPSSLPLRLAYPQLEEGPAATPWSPPRYWTYHPLPAPQAIDHTLDFAQDDQAMLAVTYPGSAAVLRVDVCPDWALSGGTLPRSQWFYGADPTTAEAATRRNSRGDNWNQYTPMWEWSHLQRNPPLGVLQYGIFRYGTSGTYRLAGELRGVWLRHKPQGGMVWADSSALSGPGHEKFLAFRMTDLGGNQFRLKFASVMAGPGFQPSRTAEARYLGNLRGLLYNGGDATSNWVTANAPHVMGLHSVTLDKSQDLFIDAVGNEQGFCLNFYQGASYQTALVVGDFVDSPHPADDGSVYPRWGLILPNSRVGLVVAGFGPVFQDYWAAYGPGFGAASNWGAGQGEGQGPVGYNELVLLTRGFTRDYPVPLWVARADESAVSNRGRVPNLYVGLEGVTSGQVGDSPLAQDGTRYYYALRSAHYNNSAYNCHLLIRP